MTAVPMSDAERAGLLQALDTLHAPCDLTACRTCTGCAHNRHDTCRRTVRCPNDRDIRTCECCGHPDAARQPAPHQTNGDER